MTEWILSASALIAAVLLLRSLLRGRVSPRIQYALWAIVLLRLLMPFSLFKSELSIHNFHNEAMKQPAIQQVQQVVNTPIVQRPSNQNDMQDSVQSPTTQLPQTPVTPPAVTVPEYNSSEGTPTIVVEQTLSLTLTDFAMYVWIAGMAVMSAWMIVCNIHFARRIKVRRHEMDIPDSLLPVYCTDAVETPCLFGLFHPAIYMTEEAVSDQQTQKYVFIHEMNHYRQLDHIWSVLRTVALILHWYNPLVWIAFRASRQDCELSCDANTLDELGEEHRGDYGRTLIKLATQTRLRTTMVAATTMADGKKAIRERIVILMKNPKTAFITMICLILCCSLVIGCTFTGASGETTEPKNTDSLTTFDTLGELLTDRLNGSSEYTVTELDTGNTYHPMSDGLFDFSQSELKLDWDNAAGNVVGFFEDAAIMVQIGRPDGSFYIQLHNGINAYWIYISELDKYVPLTHDSDYTSAEPINEQLGRDYDSFISSGRYIDHYGNGDPEATVELLVESTRQSELRARDRSLSGLYDYADVDISGVSWDLNENGSITVTFDIWFRPRAGQKAVLPWVSTWEKDGTAWAIFQKDLIRLEDGNWYIDANQDGVPDWDPENSDSEDKTLENYETLGELLTDRLYDPAQSNALGVFRVTELKTGNTYHPLNTLLFDFSDSDLILDWEKAKDNDYAFYYDDTLMVQVESLDGSFYVQFHNGKDAEWIYISEYDKFVPLKLNPDGSTYDSAEQAVASKLEIDYDSYLWRSLYIPNYGSGDEQTTVDLVAESVRSAHMRVSQESLTDVYSFADVEITNVHWEPNGDGSLQIIVDFLYTPVEGEKLSISSIPSDANEAWIEWTLIRLDDGNWYRSDYLEWHPAGRPLPSSSTVPWTQNAEVTMSYDEYFQYVRSYHDSLGNLSTGRSWGSYSVRYGDGTLQVIEGLNTVIHTVVNVDTDINWRVCTDRWIYGIREGRELVRVSYAGGAAESLTVVVNEEGEEYSISPNGDWLYLGDSCTLFFSACSEQGSVICRLYLPEMKLDILDETDSSRIDLTNVLSNHEAVWIEPNSAFAELMEDIYATQPSQYVLANGELVDDLENWVSADYKVPKSYAHYVNTATGERYTLPLYGNYYSARSQNDVDKNGDAWWNDFRPNQEYAELTQSQIDQVNEAFAIFYIQVEENGKMNDYISPANGFFRCYYNSPEDIDLNEFLQHFGSKGIAQSAQDTLTETEFRHLSEMPDWFWTHITSLDRMPVPVWKYSVEEVNAVLRYYTGVDLKALADFNELLVYKKQLEALQTMGNFEGIQELKSPVGVLYSAEYNAFYNFTSDFNPGYFNCTGGRIYNNYVELYSENSILTLVQKDGRYYIYSHQPNV